MNENPNGKDENNGDNVQIPRYEVILTDRQPKKRRGVKILLIIVGVLVLLGITIGWLLLREVREHNRSRYRTAYVVLAEKLDLVQKRSGKFEAVRELPFGATVTLDTSQNAIEQDGKTYRRCTAYLLGGQNYTCKETYYIETLAPTDLDETDYLYDVNAALPYLKTFPVAQAQALPSALKIALLKYLDDHDMENYGFSQDTNRIGQSIVAADLNGDGADDYAFALWDNDVSAPYGMVAIFCYNADGQLYYPAFWTGSDGGLCALTLFEQGARIFAGGETLVAAPACGVLCARTWPDQSPERADFEKTAIFYDPKSGQFVGYRQVALSVLQEHADFDSEMYLEEGDGGYDESDDSSDDPSDDAIATSEDAEYGAENSAAIGITTIEPADSTVQH